MMSLKISIFLLVLNSILAIDIIPDTSRIDCMPDQPWYKITNETCQARGCDWDNIPRDPTVPQCYFKPKRGYFVEKVISSNTVILKNGPNGFNPFGANFDRLVFNWAEIGSGIKVTITPTDMVRYRPPVPINSNPNIVSTDKLQVSHDNNTIFSFYVRRQSTQVSIWNTSIGGLAFSDKFLQIATYLPTDKIYGWGENIHPSLKHNFNRYTTWGMLARDQAPDAYDQYNRQNLYGVHPFYLGLEPDGSAHGVFIFNSNAQDVTTGEAPHLVYRTIGGQFEIYFFPGPTPEQVIQQYQQVIGTPFLPAYWALGYQLCRWGYKNLTDLQVVVNRTLDNGIPIDVFWTDIDYMYEYRDFSLDKDRWGGLGNYTSWLHDNGMKLTQIFDPAIEVDYYSFQRAIQNYSADFISWPDASLVQNEVNNQWPLTKNTLYMLGAVWPERNVAFPDFLDARNCSRVNPNSGVSPTFEWWANEFKIYHDMVPFDGIWIDMNEPSNFATRFNFTNSTLTVNRTEPQQDPLRCPENGPWVELEQPAYQTMGVYAWGYAWNGSYLCTKTLCMCGATMNNTARFYDTKNLYGWSEARATNYALKTVTGKRGQTISRSTFASSGHYGGHWTGDNTARWEDLRAAVIEIQEFNMFGITLVGSDICGFIGDSNPEMCARWQQLGAFHSFSRNHNIEGAKPQDPGYYPLTAQAARKANLFRYRHLPYLFSLHFASSLNGGTVIRPVFFEFPKDNNTYDLSYQFMWGKAIMIIPVIYEGYINSWGYLPQYSTWYSLYDYNYGSVITSGWQNFTAPLEYLIPVFVRAGNIIPRQKPGMTTVASRKNAFELLVAIELSPDGAIAYGELYWDDGETLVDTYDKHNYYQFTFDFKPSSPFDTQGYVLNITRLRSATNLPLTPIENIEVFGYPSQPDPSTLQVNGIPVVGATFNYDINTKVLNISANNLIDWNKNGPIWVITWNNIGAAPPPTSSPSTPASTGTSPGNPTTNSPNTANTVQVSSSGPNATIGSHASPSPQPTTGAGNSQVLNFLLAICSILVFVTEF